MEKCLFGCVFSFFPAIVLVVGWVKEGNGSNKKNCFFFKYLLFYFWEEKVSLLKLYQTLSLSSFIFVCFIWRKRVCVCQDGNFLFCLVELDDFLGLFSSPSPSSSSSHVPLKTIDLLYSWSFVFETWTSFRKRFRPFIMYSLNFPTFLTVSGLKKATNGHER